MRNASNVGNVALIRGSRLDVGIARRRPRITARTITAKLDNTLKIQSRYERAVI